MANNKKEGIVYMKKLLAMLLAVMLTVSCFSGCVNEPTTPGTQPTIKPTEPTTPTTKPTEPVDPWAEYTITTIAEALTLCEQFVEKPSQDRYYIRGTITEMQNEQYGQMVITDETGSIMVYGTYSADGAQKFNEMTNKPTVGDEVLIHGTLQNYKGNTKEIQNGRLIDFISNGEEAPKPQLPAFDSTLTIAELLALPIADGEVTEGRYYVRGTVESVVNAQYGQMIITDGKNSISVYGSYSADGATGYAELAEKPVKGDEVLLYANVKNFKGTLEINSGWIQEFTTPEFDESAYTAMSIADARLSANGTKVKVEGVVAAITYANGMKPAGVILVDGTCSIYVYGVDVAGSVSVGNKITVAASKTMWISEKEIESANKFGYKGCNQLEDAWLLHNDGGNTEFDKSWIEESTIKDILDTPVSEDISTKLYKVTAHIKEVPGSGFTNFYLNDLDGKTGSYVYTQANGADFDWLRQYDGKIVTVYVMAMNAKAASSDCFWRFLPVAVVDEGFDPSSVNAAELAVKLFGTAQFQANYTGNPALELLTKVDLELLNIAGVQLSYKSSDESVVSVKGNVLNCLKSGNATITITAKHDGKTYSQDVAVTVTMAEQGESYPTVLDAINTALNETVTVKGIVGPSLVNRDGFYLIDKTGVIAVIVNDSTVFEGLKIGQEVVLEGMRDKFHNGQGDHSGQAAITKATIVTNFYGEHEYSTESFKGEISVKDFYELDITVDQTTSVYTMTAYVVLVDGGKYKNLYLSNVPTYDTANPDNVYVRLYSSSADQYKWLQEYNGQQVTVEINPCNWNNKTYYTGCVLAVVHADGTKTLNKLNFGN